MIRTPFVISVFITSALASTAFAQDANRPSVSLKAGFQQQTHQVQAVGEHNVADSATLRARGCEGFVATDPALSVTYDAGAGSSAVIIRAESPTDLIMLVGTAANAWFCADDTVGTNPEIRLPAGSGSYSVWVGTRNKGRAAANVILREAAAGAAGSATSPGNAAPSGPCGSPAARIPMSIAPEDWSRFSCQSQASAGTNWAQCHGRSAYSDSRADGCPGAELCCPYDGFNLAASQAKAKGTPETAVTTPRSTTPATGTSTTTPSTSATATPNTPPSNTNAASSGGTSGAVATGAPHQLTVEANPFGTRGGATVVYWRGFANAQIPVRTETRSDAPVLYHLQGGDFPRAATDSLVVVTSPRKIRARTATSLNTADGALQIAAGQEIELLGPANATQCKMRIRTAVHVAACPHDAVFEGVGASFSGLSPLAYQWWIAVENETRQRGWVHIDLSRPEFVVALPPSL